MRKRSAIIFLALAFIVSVSRLEAVDKLKLDNPEDTAYLPYAVKINEEFNANSESYAVKLRARILTPFDPEKGIAEFIIVHAPPRSHNRPVTFDFCSYPPIKMFNQKAVRLHVKAWEIFYDKQAGRKMIFGVGDLRDSAWAFVLDTETLEIEKKFLMTGEDRNGDGEWIPEFKMLITEDYDCDGRVETFFQINRVRESGYRTLYCIELETFSIEWSLPVASLLAISNGFYALGDSISPKIIFAAHGPSQGAEDANYDDRFKYLSIVNSNGELEFNRVVGIEPECLELVRDEADSCFYLIHDIEPTPHDSVLRLDSIDAVRETLKPAPRLSKVLDNGEIIKTILLKSQGRSAWLAPYEPENELTLYVNNADRIVRAYNSNLEVIAESDRMKFCAPSAYFEMPTGEPAIFCGRSIYTESYEHLAHANIYGSIDPLTYNEDGRIKEYLVANEREFYVIELQKQGFLNRLSAFYIDNKIYFVMALTGLFVGLLVVNYYRHRNRRNLVLIQKQKTELEETHAELKAAQEKIVAQEKYVQARDIAGGFAHEIRNALTPARHALSILSNSTVTNESPEKLQKLAGLTRKAVIRAVDITQMVSEYSRVEAMKKPEPVEIGGLLDEIRNYQRDILDDRGIKLEVRSSGLPTVSGNREQLRIVFDNLIRNAVDALRNEPDPSIEISTAIDNSFLLIRIADNGEGILPENLPRIFDFFFSTKPDRGTGIGLAMARKIVEMYDGSIEVQSTLGEGTTFRVRLSIWES